MMQNKLVGIEEAARITGLSEYELRTGAISGKYPNMRAGGKHGKILFEINLLQ